MGASLFVIDDEVWHARGVIFIDGDGRVGVVLRNIQIDPLQIVLGHFFRFPARSRRSRPQPCCRPFGTDVHGSGLASPTISTRARAGAPRGCRDRPAPMDSPQIPDSPAAFLESRRAWAGGLKLPHGLLAAPGERFRLGPAIYPSAVLGNRERR